MPRFFAGLEPERVWHHFEEICKLPHGSGNEDAVRKYIADFAAKQGLEHYYQPQAPWDDAGKRVVVVYKKAAPGLENKPTVVLQSHLDMVCVPNAQIFPLRLVFCDSEGKPGHGWVKAGGYNDQDGTSLGADDGIGVALALAILEDTRHQLGPVECLFTVNEETGMDGARDFEPGLLKGRVYINLDEEELKSIIYGCAGGLKSTFHWSLGKEPVPSGVKCFSLKVSGLKGGHSGAAIHLGRANAIQLAVRILSRAVNEKIRFQLASFTGGSLHQSNVIPMSAQASLIINPNDAAKLGALAAEMAEDFRMEFLKIEDSIETSWEEIETPEVAVSLEDTLKIIDTLMLLPHGVQKTAPEKSEVVTTSTNFASVALDGGEATIVCMHRSSLESGLDWMRDTHQAIARSSGGRILFSDRYPAWSPVESSDLLQKAKNVYNSYFRGEYKTEVVHAGLECGWVVNKYQTGTPMDCIAIGPTVLEPHSRRERLEISSVAKFHQCVLEILQLYTK